MSVVGLLQVVMMTMMMTPVAPFYIFKTVTSTFDNTTTPNLINLDIRYVLKSARQFNDPLNQSLMGSSGTFNDFRVGDSIAKQNFQVSAHVERDWTNFVTLTTGTWNDSNCSSYSLNFGVIYENIFK